MIIIFDDEEKDILKECIRRINSFISFVSALEKVYTFMLFPKSITRILFKVVVTILTLIQA
jgi:hypothetical protein